MRFILIILIFISACGIPDDMDIPRDVPYGTYPPTPAFRALEKAVVLEHEALNSRKETFDEGGTRLLHFYEGAPFTGWVREFSPEDEHRYRFTRLEKGYEVWQIGYYQNRELDFDFHLMNGKKYGSQRSWRKDGTRLFDQFYQPEGVRHGHQRRWYANGRLAEDALYQHGQLIYSAELDSMGNLISSKGELPLRYRKL
jgi:antitoxin component YwqK of YwqJK toxin-antitoxin module